MAEPPPQTRPSSPQQVAFQDGYGSNYMPIEQARSDGFMMEGTWFQSTRPREEPPPPPPPPPPPSWNEIPQPRPRRPPDTPPITRPGNTYTKMPHHAEVSGPTGDVVTHGMNARTAGEWLGESEKPVQRDNKSTFDHNHQTPEDLDAFRRIAPELRLPYVWPGHESGMPVFCGVVAGPTKDGRYGRSTPVTLYLDGPAGPPGKEPTDVHVPQLHPDDSLVVGMWLWGIVAYPPIDPESEDGDLYFAQPPVWVQGPIEGEVPPS
jgi:hypothetical protein